MFEINYTLHIGHSVGAHSVIFVGVAKHKAIAFASSETHALSFPHRHTNFHGVCTFAAMPSAHCYHYNTQGHSGWMEPNMHFTGWSASSLTYGVSCATRCRSYLSCAKCNAKGQWWGNSTRKLNGPMGAWAGEWATWCTPLWRVLFNLNTYNGWLNSVLFWEWLWIMKMSGNYGILVQAYVERWQIV